MDSGIETPLPLSAGESCCQSERRKTAFQNWQLGRDLVLKKAEERWGAGVVEQVSLDMQNEFPESTNFSARNLWYI